MGTEIERKFLVSGDAWRAAAAERVSLHQGYLAVDNGNTVRIRLAEGRAWLTVKGPAAGARRTEFEYAVPPDDALTLLALCGNRVVDKIRSRVPHAGHVWEVDQYEGPNAGLITAEVEMAAECEEVQLPSWLGPEITGDRRFDNASLSMRPFGNWEAAERLLVDPSSSPQ
jgi:adenylate cyclase